MESFSKPSSLGETSENSGFNRRNLGLASRRPGAKVPGTERVKHLINNVAVYKKDILWRQQTQPRRNHVRYVAQYLPMNLQIANRAGRGYVNHALRLVFLIS